MTVILRPDQFDVEQRIYQAWNSGARNVLTVASTGWGKSVLIGEIALKRHLLGSTQVKIAHRNELVGQLSMHVARRGIPHRIIAPAATVRHITAEHRQEFNGQSFVNPDANCSVAGIDTLIARQQELTKWAEQVDHWTIDEAHHVLQVNKWGKGVGMFPNAAGLGVTASPRRADNMGLGRTQSDGTRGDGVFDQMVLAPDMRWLIDNGCLCDYQIVVPETDFSINDADLAPSGDWSTARMREASEKSHIVGDAVEQYVRWAYGKRGICFATDVETAAKIAQQFNDVGIPAASVSAKTPSEVRNEYIRRFRRGQLSVLVNVDLFGEGFDVPAVEVVIMARPTASLAVYLQQFGRALRLMAGKLYGLIIDLVSNVLRHGLPDKPHAWSMDRQSKRAKSEPDPELQELTVCRGCSRPYDKPLPACPYCGWSPPLPEIGVRVLKQVDGDLMLLGPEQLAIMRAATTLESPASVLKRVSAVAGAIAGRGALDRQMERHAAQQRLSAAIAQWAGIQRYRGRSDQESYRRFYLTLGVDVLSALATPRADMDRMADLVEGWCNV
jgi:superfamily II DNA or RNA helicase